MSSSCIQARVLSRELSEQFRQSFVVDNRPGASGMIGAESVVNSPADGYTVLFTTAALAMLAMVSGEVDFLFAEALLAAPQIKAGKVRALFEQDALISAGGTPEELGAHLKREIECYAEVIRKGNITAQ